MAQQTNEAKKYLKDVKRACLTCELAMLFLLIITIASGLIAIHTPYDLFKHLGL